MGMIIAGKIGLVLYNNKLINCIKFSQNNSSSHDCDERYNIYCIPH